MKRVGIFIGLVLLTAFLGGWFSLPFVGAAPGASVAPSTSEAISHWSIDASTNAVDGASKVSITDYLGDFVLRCKPHFEAYIIPKVAGVDGELRSQVLDSDETAGYGDSNDQQLVRFRLNGKVFSGEWGLSESQTALFIPENMLRTVISAKRIIIEYKPYEEQRQTYSVDFGGLSEAMNKAGCSEAAR